MWAIWTLTLLWLLQGTVSELITNGDFEESFDNNWYASAATLTRSTDAYSGTYSGQITSRTQYWGGLSQMVPLEAGKKYRFSAWVKLLANVPGRMYHQMDVLFDIDYTNSNKEYRWFGRLPMLRQEEGWQMVGGDVSFGSQAIQQARMYFQTTMVEVEYLVDKVSLTEIVPNPNWRDEANQRIDANRKSNILISVTIRNPLDPASVELRLSQTSHEFPFGTAVQAWRMTPTDTVNQNYRQFLFDNFNWAVLENALKWKQMEPTQGQINYALPEGAINVLRANGMPVRGHCIAWGVSNRVPDWLFGMTAEQVRDAIDTRVQGVVSRFRGQLVHWDVNNELLHGDTFENMTSDPEITQQIHLAARTVDPDVQLFINDYAIVSEGTYTSAFLKQAKVYSANGVPINGIGIQSHLSGTLDIDRMAHRLEVLSAAALPIWVTELDVNNANVAQRADGYEDAVRLYFSDPNIEGIMLWGFWDQAHWKPNASLVDGNDFVVNAAGLRWQQLLNEEWRTSANFNPVLPTEEFGVRGFHGNYSLQVFYEGTLLETQTFTVPKRQDTVVVIVDI